MKNNSPHLLNHLPLILLILACCCYSACKNGTPNQHYTAKGEQIIDSAGNFLNEGNEVAYLSYLEKAFKQINKPTELDMWFKYSSLVNYYLNYSKKPRQAMIYADSMLYIVNPEPTRFKFQYAVSLFTKGDILLYNKEYEKAFSFYFKSKIFSSRYLDDCNKNEITYRMGLVRYRQENFRKALPFYYQALAENSRCMKKGFKNEIYFPQAVLNTMGLSYEKLGRPDSAIIFYQKALAVIQAKGFNFPEEQKFMKTARGVIYGNLGGAYELAGQYARAEGYLRKSISINDQAGYAMEDAQTAKTKLARCLLSQGRLSGANTLINEIQDYIKSKSGHGSDIDGLTLKVRMLKTSYLEKNKQMDSAYYALKSYDHFKDSINKLKQGSLIADMDSGMEYAESRHKMEILARTNQIKTLFLICAAVMLILSCLILWLVNRSLRTNKANLVRMTALNEEIKRKNIHISQSLEDLQQSQTDNAQLLQIVAHDLRNPIGAMIMANSLLINKRENTPKEQEMFLMIKRSGEQAIALINELLESNGHPEGLKKQTADLYDILNYAVKTLQHKADEKSQQIRFTATHIDVVVNRAEIWRVITNLLANAIKFSEPDTEIQISTQIKENSVMIFIQDQGIGIPEEIRDSLFEMHTTASRTGTNGEKSFGMGLSISRQIVEAHGGKIWFESSPSSGSIFVISLPV